MAAQRNDTVIPAPTPEQPRRSGTTTSAPPLGEEHEDDRIVFSSWDAPLVPPER
jgi:hypothetical protein